MSQQERWDVVLKVLDGPLQSQVESIYRGPIVRMGANPGPGGVQLQGYRGLDARQCTITAYTGGTAAVSPVGTNQVRLAPHANVNWKDIDPIGGPEYLSDGCAMHIGPVNRGATLQFVECRRLGVWKQGEIRSEVGEGLAAGSKRGQQMAGGAGYGASVGGGAIPKAYDVRKVGRLRATRVPPWFVGCLGLTTSVTAVSLMSIPLGTWYLYRDVKRLGPEEDKYEFFKSVDIVTRPPTPELLEGLEQPMYSFVMAENIVASGNIHTGLEKPEKWDRTFAKFVAKSVEQHVRQRGFFRNLDERRQEYATVVKELRKAKLPEVFAGIPYQESRYRSNAQSWACAKGYWQFMPEVAHRVNTLSDIGFQVRDCSLRGRTGALWNPEKLAPAYTGNSPYIDDRQCQITSCRIDERTDLLKSTKAAIFTLKKAWENPDIQGSGAAVQITILSHNAGYNDEPYLGRVRRSNLLPATRAWIERNGSDQGPYFYGNNILCPDHTGNANCGSLLRPETQHYAYNIVAQHFLAVCYYSKEYPEEPAFEPWKGWALPESYCSQFKIPSKAEVRNW